MNSKLMMVGLGFLLGVLAATGLWWGLRSPQAPVVAVSPGPPSPSSAARGVPSSAGQAPGLPAKQLYTCGMHPQIIQDHPGNCPICGMKLTPVRKQPAGGDGHGSAAESAGAISIDPVTVQNMNLRTGTVTRGPLRRVIRTVGVVDYDETKLADVTTKFKGWIEKLYVDTTGEQVHKGEPLFEIYSPELYSAQTEYIVSVKPAGEAAGNLDFLRASALTKLRFFDISDGQIAELEKTRQAKKTLQVLAPRDGIVMEKMVVEGQMADAGMRLFRIADLGTVWVLAQVYEQDLPFIKLGQEADVTLDYLPDRVYRGRVTYVYQTVDDRTRTAKVRMEFHNPGYALKPGMFASIKLEATLAADVVLVPDMAVLRSGATNTVFVALPGGRFDARTVTLGPRADGGFYQVLSGLKDGEKVVTSGQFMLDSESQLREAIQKMTAAPGAAEPQLGIVSAPGTAEPQLGIVSAPGTAEPQLGKAAATSVYLCPMPEHLSITYKAPGHCPLCGMELVPVSPDLLAKMMPGTVVDYYTCPMPEHADVHEAKTGKCPKCAMTLVPVMKAVATAAAAPTPAAAPEPLVPAAAKAWHVCPMPEDKDVRSDKPGPCPKCGMALVPERK